MKKYASILALVVLLAGSATASLDSPSSVKVESGNSFFEGYDGKVVIFEWKADKFDDSKVTIEPSDVNGKIAGQVTETVTLEITSKTSKAKYQIRDGGRPDLKPPNYVKNEWSWATWSTPSKDVRNQKYHDWAMSNCEDVNGNGEIEWYVNEWYSDYGTQFNGEVWCATLSTDKIANIGEIESTPEEVMGATFKLSAGAISDSVKVTNSYTGSDDKGQSATLSNFAKINLQGGLESGYNFPEPNDELVAFSNSFNPNYRIIYDQWVESNYPSILDDADQTSVLKDLAVQDSDNPHDESYYEDLYRGQVEGLANKYSKSEFYSENIQFSGDSLSDGTLTVNSGNRMGSYPSFQVIVKADTVGYYIPDATPEIVDSSFKDDDQDSDNNLEEGTTGYAQVTVKNTGTGDGSFNARIASCSDGLTGSDISQEVDLKPGASETVQIPVSFNSGSYDSKEISGSCTVQVENLRDNTETVSTQVGITGEQASECKAGYEYSEIRDEDGDGDNDHVILKCGSNGLKKSVQKTCQDQYRAVKTKPGEYSCQKKDPGKEVCGNNKDDDQDGKVDENCGNPNTEVCGNGVDDDGDGKVDENCQDPPEKCLINVKTDNPMTPTTTERFKALCFQGDPIGKLQFVIMLVGGLLGMFGGYQVGSFVNGERQIQGRNKYIRKRSVSRMERSKNTSLSRSELLGAGIGLAIGAGIGWYLGIWGTGAVLLGLGLAKYFIPGY